MDEYADVFMKPLRDGEEGTLPQRVARMIEDLRFAHSIFNYGGVVILWGHDEPRLCFVVTEEVLELRYEVRDWPHPHEPVRSSTLWKRVPLDEAQNEKALGRVLRAAKRARQRQFKPCRFCGEPTPVEEQDEGACYGCQEGHPGRRVLTKRRPGVDAAPRVLRLQRVGSECGARLCRACEALPRDRAECCMRGTAVRSQLADTGSEDEGKRHGSKQGAFRNLNRCRYLCALRLQTTSMRPDSSPVLLGRKVAGIQPSRPFVTM